MEPAPKPIAEWVARLDRVTVRFGSTTALSAVSLDFAPGEVHALLGENGAGKSTALRLLARIIRPHGGRVLLAAGARVGWAPQELELPEELTIAEWLFLNQELTRWGLLDRRTMKTRAEAALAHFGLAIPADTRLARLAPAERKIVQLLRALAGPPDLLLLDEPTAVLSEGLTEALFSMVAQCCERGTAVVYVTHRLPEVLRIARRVSVLRDGTVVWSGERTEIDRHALLALMAGRASEKRPDRAPVAGVPAVEVDALQCGRLRDFSLRVYGGEIVGLAGLTGAGRSTLLECLAGRLRVRSGRIRIRGPVAFVPEDRRNKGLAFDLNARENLFLPPDRGWIRRDAERRQASDWFARLDIRASSVDAPLATLSGGNQQKLLLARALRRQPAVVLADEPTAGVDVRTKAVIHDWLRRYAAQGAAVVMSSSEVSELLAVCHRIVALRNGRAVAEAPSDVLDEARVVAWITGAADELRQQ